MGTDELQGQDGVPDTPEAGVEEQQWVQTIEGAYAKDVVSGTPEAFDLIHDPRKWLRTNPQIEVLETTGITTTINSHERGLRKKIIRVGVVEKREQDIIELTLNKDEPSGTAREPVGYRF
jgi:hypothetical protein